MQLCNLLLEKVCGCSNVEVYWQVTDDNSVKSPFSNYRVGQTLTSRIVCKPKNIKGGNGWELSVRPLLLKGKHAYLYFSNTVCRSFKYIL